MPIRLGYTRKRYYLFFEAAGAALVATAGGAFAAATGGGVAATGDMVAVASSCFNWRVMATDAIGIRGEFKISIFSATTSCTRRFSFNSRLVMSISMFSRRYFGKVFTF